MEYNIGIFGFVDNGKSSFVQNLTSTKMDTHSLEHSKVMTIQLNYAGFYLVDKNNTWVIQQNIKNQKHYKFHILDTPGHQILFTKMLTGIPLIHIPVLLISCYKDQANLFRIDKLLRLLSNFNKVVVIISKIDLVKKDQVFKFKEKLETILNKGKVSYTLLPFSKYWHGYKKYLASELYNIILNYTDPLDTKKDLIYLNFKSYNPNKSRITLEKLNPGILGGSINQGTLKLKDKVYINFVNYKDKWISLDTNVIKIIQSNVSKNEISNSGFLTIQVDLDPSLFQGDNLAQTILTKKTVEKINKLNLSIIQDLDKNLIINSESKIVLCILNLKTFARIIKLKNKFISVHTDKPLPKMILDRQICSKSNQEWYIKYLCKCKQV